MKVIIAIVFAIGSVSALGSGPYLPSGWRPQGPSFYLPSEVSKPSDSPLKENLQIETEASGSDALREYGPPKVDEVIQFSVNQGLPDVATEQTFFVQSLATQELQTDAEVSAAVEANTEAALVVEEVASTTEAQLAQIAEEQATEILSEAQPTVEATLLEVVAEVVEQTSEAVQEVATEAAAQEETVAPVAVNAEEEIVAPTAVAQEEVTAVVEDAVVPTAAVVEQVIVERLSEGVNNIADALVKLENEVKAAEALETAVEIKAEVSGSLQQAPEGFLEYGPPGFREYGPPKAEDLARAAAVQVAPTSAFENNEVRRRRFSPKFKSGHKKH
ncbi:hypothetical protein PYW08_010448 [Mythimna loreyi]|uniref:Uncharacterized protein n=1 Tax=Mythimna loreyi TaxID=667449 RepID=A0ACC2Q8B8_9NEOP|nr:hypothetical protein PYW08_010448 [Mythimna loreyi]